MKYRVLVADDDDFDRSMFCDLLLADGYTVVEASNGNDALKIIAEEDPHVVITDLQMPPEDWGGIWLIRKLQIQHPNLPIIVLSGRDNISKAVEAMRYGAKDYVQKASAKSDLCLTVDNIILSLPTSDKPIINTVALLSKLLNIEKQYRLLISERYTNEFSDGCDNRIRKYLPFDQVEAIEQRFDNKSSGQCYSLIDYTYFSHTVVLINKEWRLFQDRLIDKKRFNLWMDLLVGVRNDLAHGRPVSDIDLRKSDVYCDEVFKCLNIEK